MNSKRIRTLVHGIGLCCFFATVIVPARASAGITLNVRDAALQDVVSLIATQAGINIVLDGAESGPQSVTLRLKNVSLTMALQSVETAFGLVQAWEGHVLHIGPPDTILREFPSAAKGIGQRVFTIINADADTVARELQSMLPAGTIIVPDSRTGSVIIKGTNNAIASAAQLIASLDQAHYDGPSYKTAIIPLNNLKASDALTLLRSQVPPTGTAQMSASDHPNAMVVTGTPDYIRAVQDVAANLDKPGAQVRFSVRVLDVTPVDYQRNVGILWGGIKPGGPGTGVQLTPGAAITTFVNRTLPIAAELNLLQSEGRGKILAQPSITTLNNEKAVLNVGAQYPIVFFNPQSGLNEVQFINVGVNLTLTPTIGSDGNVTCVLDTDYSEILSDKSAQYPTIGQRHVASTLRVGDGQTIVIAGLFEDVSQYTIQKLPFLGDIPILGEFFRNRSTTHRRDEVVFMITPHIVKPSDFHTGETSPDASDL